ncbi:MAG: hypothetical protein F6K54_22710 [Okeania sp. SIO3B5]|uniref:hypothetical protein n=1 Tax=Okeania sp. SIO3B5 TaxID=2607811 RepID=UPI0014010B7A|nr:hypothetical protein [Okeania sp. SIO3B5]NEO55632.1 hypothetical protein [Okeania sp. SIO3B5]
MSREQIAKKIIDKRAGKCARIGFLTSFVGWVTIIIPLLIDIVLSTKAEAEMIYLLAYAYGYEPDDARLETLKNYILSQTAPEGEPLNIVIKLGIATARELWEQKGREAIGGATIELGQEYIKQVFKKPAKLARNTTGKTVGKVLIKFLAKTLGKIITKFFFIVGAFVSYWLNNWSAKSTGKLALKWLDRLDEELEHDTDNII